MKKLLMVSLMLVFIWGCVTAIDPETGETLYSLDPNVVEAIEPLVESGLTIGVILATLFPAVTIITHLVTLGAGIFGTWKKIKPQVTAAQTEANLYHTTTHCLVTAIEDYKELDPDGWEKLKAKIKVGDKVENVIRAIRGLPAIE